MFTKTVTPFFQVSLRRILRKTTKSATTDFSKSHPILLSHYGRNFVSSSTVMAKAGDDGVTITNTIVTKSNNTEDEDSKPTSSCSEGYPPLDDEDEEEVEEMFVEPHPSLKLDESMKEWGGPRRGGTLAEPTRFGDWERKGRCTDF